MAEVGFAAVVEDIRLEQRVEGRQQFQVLLDRTEFRAGDRGRIEAVAPSGTRLIAPVLRVVEEPTGEVWHVVEKPLMADTPVQGFVERVEG